MYRRRLSSYNRRGGTTSMVFNMVLLGILVGVGFLLYDRWQTPPPAVQFNTQTPTPIPTFTLPPSQPLPSPTTLPEARVLIPTAGVNALVVNVYLDGESWDVSQLGEYAGHLQGTAWINTPGNVALAGHVEMRDGRPGIFARIEELRMGDPVILTQSGVEQRYAVTDIKRVSPDDLSVLYPTSNERITLITCDSYDFLQNAYQERIVVVAERVT